MPDSWSLFDDYHHHLSLLSLPLLSSSLICVSVYPPKSTFSRPPPCCAHSCLSSLAHNLAMPSLIYLLLPITLPCPPKSTFARPPPCHTHPNLPPTAFSCPPKFTFSRPPPCHAHPNLPSLVHRLATPTQVYLLSPTASPYPLESTFCPPSHFALELTLPKRHRLALLFAVGLRNLAYSSALPGLPNTPGLPFGGAAGPSLSRWAPVHVGGVAKGSGGARVGGELVGVGECDLVAGGRRGFVDRAWFLCGCAGE